jgi:hypothetical protein
MGGNWRSEANLSVFLALLVLACFVLPSMGLAREDEQLYFDIIFPALWVAGVAIAWKDRVLFYLASVVALPALIVHLAAWWKPASKLVLWRQGLTLASILMISLVLLRQVFGAGLLTRVRIQGAVAVYLLFGLGWAHAYDIAAILNPGSFAGVGAGTVSVGVWVYYSFVTLTTVGYGDVTPVRPIARTLAIGEALTGQLYLAVLLARLVALQVKEGAQDR